ncbi:BOI-related E3 ubiquitin-protein ligase 1 [Aegilops tauschii subsp. strangulata]|uniref:RING-type domain-containing protein n=3 Tax=Triticinae TaxID=1648030 RepID=A0A452YV73_AEGTS|nr:BOI-related E3 ubiquitin-protein ligase 1 [Aegilops tauschii subsp. strangulata]XP_044449895.1 BOI-related E3 ubiquitin-protein ligase 1-like [Triticum aestivum]
MGDLGVRVVGRGCAAPMEPRKEMAPPSLEQQQQQPPLFMDFSRRDGVADGGNGRKRPRETVAPPARLFSLQAPQGSPGHKVIHLAQLHRRPPATGLRLDFDEGGSEHAACTSSTSPLIPGELAAQCGRYSNEIDRLLQEHAERLRLALADTRRRQNRSLLGAAEALAARRVREMEAETFKAARRGVELEERLARLRAEAASWQAKAMSDQSTAAALHAQLQQAAATAQARSGKAALDDDGAADDAESGFIDPDRVVEVAAPPPARPCRGCRLRPATTVLLPCRHLCVCDACDPGASASLAAAAACPTCRCPVTGTVQVFFA